MKNPQFIIILSIFLTLSICKPLFADPLKPGTTAPALTLKDQDGNDVNLADEYQKGILLLYFYPKADTPGCTAQACSLRDSFPNLKIYGLRIIGVSSDKPRALKKFQQKHKIPFPLLSDPDGALANQFGVPFHFGFHKRTSFLIKDGIIQWTNLNPKTSNHSKEVLEALDSIKITPPHSQLTFPSN
ncbi:MAG: peroxiredoxin [Chthoniobacterales bacterium]|nr:peroxiredoxin [Chthoniobacterales bacterium]MCX7713372.1 peroxiredoxin [Chthoniobacterales bacterium]